MIAIVIVDEDRDQETGETAIEKETLIMRETPGIAGTEIGTETEEGNDRSRRLLFPEQDRHLEKVSAPLECKCTSIAADKHYNLSFSLRISNILFYISCPFIAVETTS